MALYLLDKNVVEDIKKSLKGIPTAGVAQARAIDRKGNTISPLLSILEGSAQRALSGPELHDQLMIESQAVGMFYRWARTDSDYLQKLGASMVAALAPHMREKTDVLVPLAMKLQALLARQANHLDARKMLPQIDSLAAEHAVNLSHPLVSCAIACLYQSSSARKVLKPAVTPNAEVAYNAVVDIRFMMEAAYIRKMWNAKGWRESVQLFSGDKNLNELARMLEIRVETTFTSNEFGYEVVTFTSTVSEKMLPNLRKLPKEMERVLAYLRTSRDNNQSIVT